MKLLQDALFEDEANGAVIDGPYRYTLWRTWTGRPNPVRCGWIMLNPSTADACDDDPTIRRCRSYAKQWGFEGIVVRNLFALRATNPAELIPAVDPVGPDNDFWPSNLWEGVSRIVVAWGTGRYPRLCDERWEHVAVAWGTGRYPRLCDERWEHVAALLESLGPLCLRTGVDGQPVHPLYQPSDLKPVPWHAPRGATS